MNLKEWLQHGVDRGWSSTMVCETHDGVPRTEEEQENLGSNGETCVHIVRIYLDTDLDEELNDSDR